MPSSMQFLLLLFCQIYFVSAKLQLHPTFAVKRNFQPFFGDYFTGSAETDWIPSRQTVLYHLMQDLITLKIIVTIENLPRNEDIRMKFKYRCSPSDTEAVHEMRHPFQFTSAFNRICTKALPLSISTKFSDWISNTTYQLKLEVANTDASRVLLNDALTHNLRIQLEFIGSHWRLESNGLFLRNWDPLLRLNDAREMGKTYIRQYLTDDAINLMRFMNYSARSGIVEKQFIAPEVTNLIKNAPEFVQATIAIGAMLSINSDMCDGSTVRAMAFMSKQYLYHYRHESMKVMRIDAYSGKIWYSRYGLMTLANSLVTKINPVSAACDNGVWGCTVDKICTWLEFNPINGAAPYVRKEDVLRVRRSENPYKDIAGETAPIDECHALEPNPGRVSIFARAASNYVVCPIICARIEQQYAFYKGDAILHPLRDKTFTWMGAVSVHKSGAVLMFSQLATHLDSGEYRCTAAGVEAKFQVDIVALPLFSVRDTVFVGGELPPIIYAIVGRGYTVNCTVFHSNMRSVTVTPEFYVVVDKRHHNWTKLSGDDFTERLKFFDSTAKITVSSTSYSTTLTLTVSHVPQPTAVFDFSHRFVCNAAASAEDMKRYGVPEYSVQSGSDVIVVPPPTADDIEATMSPCCASGCFGKNCIIMYSLKPEVINRLKSIGLDARGRFKIGARNLSTEAMKSVTYDTNSASLQLETGKMGILEMTEEERKSFLQLVPVFEYFVPSGSDSKVSTKPPLPSSSVSDQSGAGLCNSDSSCYASTESDKSLMESLRIGAKFVLDATAANISANGTIDTFNKLYANLQDGKSSVMSMVPSFLRTVASSLCAVAVSYASSN